MPLSELVHADLEPVLRTHTGNEAFSRCLESVSAGESLLRLLGRYIHFNSVFGGGVANLAGEIAVRQDLFRDPQETVELLADRSVEVASDIFFAAVDEFDDRSTARRDTHRTLAQATVKGAGQYFHHEGAALNAIIRPNASTLDAMQRVREGYGLDQAIDTPKLFRALGFHAGSEVLADREFALLDRYLHTHHAALVEYLEQTKIEINAEQHNAYFWIFIHTSVEADHFAFATKGANRALRFYTGKEDGAEVKGWIVDGFAQFAEVQTAFMANLMDA
ncbi:MAG TPA: hypothetical protein VKU00_18920 [Chthonomonadaceae bacterium]|nr:hypothetical protein [Chthonomonadaceae bacterium]